MWEARYRPFGDADVFYQAGASVEYTYSANRDFSSAVRMDYFHARWYNPSIGRFITPDPVERAGGDTQWGNLYVYCLNSPKTLSDRMGMDWAGDLWNGFVAVLTFIPNEIVGVVNWYAAASDAERGGFWAGIIGGILTGLTILAIAGSCVVAACAGLLLMAPFVAFIGATAAGAVASITVTKALGGTPTAEGVSHAMFWGGLAGGLVGGAAGARSTPAASKSASPKPVGALYRAMHTFRTSESGVAQGGRTFAAFVELAGRLGEKFNPARFWSKVPYKTASENLEWHFAKYAGDNPALSRLSPHAARVQYTRDALALWDQKGGRGVPHALDGGGRGILIDQGAGNRGGIYTTDGKIVTFWYYGGG